MNINPKEGNEPIAGKLYRVIDPQLAATSVRKGLLDVGLEHYENLYRVLLHSKCIMLLSVSPPDPFDIIIRGSYLLEEHVYNFYIIGDGYSLSHHLLWDSYFEVL